jgi:hypothetical protein
MATKDEALKEMANATKRQLEWRAMNTAWEQTDSYLGLHAYPPAVRIRMRSVFDAAWQAATRYHTAEVKKR